jgi:hypothetical protein
MTLPTEDMAFEDAPSTEVVHWMEPGELRVGPVGLAAALAAGFTLGLAAAFAALWIVPRREALPPWRWRRGSVH